MLLFTRKHLPMYNQNSEHLIREEDKNTKSFVHICIAYQFGHVCYFQIISKILILAKKVYRTLAAVDLPLELFCRTFGPPTYISELYEIYFPNARRNAGSFVLCWVLS